MNSSTSRMYILSYCFHFINISIEYFEQNNTSSLFNLNYQHIPIEVDCLILYNYRNQIRSEPSNIDNIQQFFFDFFSFSFER